MPAIIWNVNVYSTPDANATCRLIANLAHELGGTGAEAWLELGNEFYDASQGQPRFPDSHVYAAAMLPIVHCARAALPKARIAVVGRLGPWSAGLKPFVASFDAITYHDYAPSLPEVHALPLAQQPSYVAAYSKAALELLVTDSAGARWYSRA